MSTLNSVRTDVLEIYYFDSGPKDGPVAMLLHGWPDSPETWAAVAETLNARGWRTIVPFLRGFGPNRFLDEKVDRSAQLTALASDAVGLADALKLPRFAVIGHDWGGRTAYILAAQRPERLSHCVAISVGYGASALPSLNQARQFWYQWLFTTPLGEAYLAKDRRKLCEYLWRTWSPSWSIGPEEFDQCANAFDNPDWLPLSLHGYRHRWGLVAGDTRYDAMEQVQSAIPVITVPTLVLHGEDDQCIEPASSKGGEPFFSNGYSRIGLTGVGHFPQRESPEEVSHYVIDWLERSNLTTAGAAHSVAIREGQTR